MNNIMLMTDSYKVSHWQQYPPNTKHIYSYFESRGGLYPKVVFFGLQYLIKKYLVGSRVSPMDVMEASEFFHKHFGKSTIFNYDGWSYIAEKHNGRLPVIIKAVPEGTVVDTKNVLFTVENTDPECFWLTSYLETLLEQVWYPATIATQSYFMKKTIQKYLEETGSDPADFKLHDFGYRGSSSQESAAIGDAAHLLSFQGTDTLAGIVMLQDYYHADMPGFSIPAAEHSTITSWGQDHEKEAYENMLTKYPHGLVAVVSDSYDIYKACESLWGGELKDWVMGRNGTLVVRPDSGEPTIVVPTVLRLLGKAFGYTTNEKGYKVLPTQVRVIQGDGVDEKTLYDILMSIKAQGWSADNIAFGSGGGLLQKVNRDTLRFAYKCSDITVGNVHRDVSKAPITDAMKVSKKGRLALNHIGGQWITQKPQDLYQDFLEPVFMDGILLKDQTLEEIRGRIK